MGNITTVQQIYAAFGRGDIPAILEHLADSVEWEYGISKTEVPWLQLQNGKTNVSNFFESLKQFDLHKFEPKVFFENGNIVVALIDVELTVKATGIKIIEEDETHIWHFNTKGQVIKYGHRLDTHRHWLAYKGKNSLGINLVDFA
ncbi:nuclear transport factor 2 family protein [Lyngbya confervoides]|uniref:Nuclear transport factor 2 family protein n=1 Tax=Lyngbya confervoides BDU141951 TaxID=1574623 RepID=A0ABD4T0D8_9CYAN|nr:nuclear transport factor 2 family protein [Lyngbya confervoides]MCM1982070.1 nuclear transport factor 2 family protein [Lyngbya confervoides BDU141951]